MPILRSEYTPPLLLRNGHIQTIFSRLFRKIEGPSFSRERIDTPDGDFLDLDWLGSGSARIAILSHGLESNSGSTYIRGMVKALNRHGWDVLVWNFRGCSGEPNRLPRSYHSGETGDLHQVIQYASTKHTYSEIYLIGFSLGGNVTLKYLGERSENVDPRIQKAVVISVPCDLAAGAEQLNKGLNKYYLRRFMRSLHEKVRLKKTLLPGEIDDSDLEKVKNFRSFDDRFTAPLHGFRDAEDYWKQCSSKPFISEIKVPVLIINAADDPFLSEPCYPVQETQFHINVFLEMPSYGGHVGFIDSNEGGEYWSEQRTIAFLNGDIGKESRMREDSYARPAF